MISLKKIFNKLRTVSSYNKAGGYVLLLSVLISSIILAVGLGVANLTLKGLALSSAGRDSQFAFYAADSGGECALYWDISPSGFSDTVFATSSTSIPPSSGVTCDGEDIASSWTITSAANSATTEFSLEFANDRCATVVVEKTNGGSNTTIQSRGYNSCNTNFSRRLERAVQVTY